MSCFFPSRLGGANPSRYWLCNSSATCAKAAARSCPARISSIAAACFLRNAREAGVGHVGQHHGLETAGTDARGIRCAPLLRMPIA